MKRIVGYFYYFWSRLRISRNHRNRWSIGEMAAALDAWERRITEAPARDNLKAIAAGLELYGDGSGKLWVDWRNCQPDELPPGVPDPKKLLRYLFETQRDSAIEFSTLGQLRAYLESH